MLPDGAARLLLGVATVGLAYGILFGAGELLRRRGIAGETTRTLVHVGASFLALGLPVLFDSPWPVVLLAAVFAATMVASESHGLLGSIHDVPRRTVGAALYPFGIAAAFTLTGGAAPGYPIAVLALGLGDPAASLAGNRFARRYLRIWGSWRSLEGSACAFLVSAVAAASVIGLLGGIEAASSVAAAVVIGMAVTVGATAALAEAVSPDGFDNVTIPTLTAAVVVGTGEPWRIGAVIVTLAALTLVGIVWHGSVAPGPAREGRAR